MQQTITRLLTRDLQKLKREIELYPDEASLWSTSPGISNSGGNLCLHLIGNLKTYVGDGLARTGYVRDRNFEFTVKNVPRTELYREIDETILAVTQGLAALDADRLREDYPVVIWQEAESTVFTLVHLHGHLNYHLGQINYHRRMLTFNP